MTDNIIVEAQTLTKFALRASTVARTQRSRIVIKVKVLAINVALCTLSILGKRELPSNFIARSRV